MWGGTKKNCSYFILNAQFQVQNCEQSSLDIRNAWFSFRKLYNSYSTKQQITDLAWGLGLQWYWALEPGLSYPWLGHRPHRQRHQALTFWMSPLQDCDHYNQVWGKSEKMEVTRVQDYQVGLVILFQLV